MRTIRLIYWVYRQDEEAVLMSYRMLLNTVRFDLQPLQQKYAFSNDQVRVRGRTSSPLYVNKLSLSIRQGAFH